MVVRGLCRRLLRVEIPSLKRMMMIFLTILAQRR